MTDPAENQDAFVALLTGAQVALRLYVQSLMPGDASAHDVVQQANTILWKKREDFTPGTNFKAWAFAIARYEVLNYRKQQARDSRLVFGEELEQIVAEDLAERDEDTERRHEVLKGCLQKLRKQDRELLLHRYTTSAGTLEDYARRTGRSKGGLKVTLHRLRNALLSCIEKQLTPLKFES